MSMINYKTHEVKKVLVVDDDPDIAELISYNLNAFGFEVMAVASGKAALSHVITQGMPDCILLDIMMPGPDGLETCARLRGLSEAARTPIVMVSARSALEDKTRAFSLGATAYLSKGELTMAGLLDCVAQVTSSYH